MILAIVEGVLLITCICYIVYTHIHMRKRIKPRLANIEPTSIGFVFDKGNLHIDLPRKDITNIVIDGNIIHIDGQRIVLGFRYNGGYDAWHLETILTSFGYRVSNH